MSLLDRLKRKKMALKPSQTVVTRLDGRKFLEVNSEMFEIQNTGHGYVVDTKPDDVPAEIMNHLYLGSQDCCERSILEKFNIKQVVSVGIEPLKVPDVSYTFVECLDLPDFNLDDTLRVCIPIIHQAVQRGTNVLVHCNAGVSRSSSVVIAYLMQMRELSYSDAYNLVKSARNCIRPNDGFQKQLRRLDFN